MYEPLNGDSQHFLVKVLRHPSGAIEFVDDLMLFGDEREALAYAKAVREKERSSHGQR
jgi:hypothetical protein